jgi:predicted nucleotidyltransferase
MPEAGLPQAFDFEREMIERSRPLAVGGLELRVPTAEDLLITKAVAQRPQDLADIESILNSHQQIDAARVRRWVGEFAAALESPEMLETLEQLLRRRGR